MRKTVPVFSGVGVMIILLGLWFPACGKSGGAENAAPAPAAKTEAAAASEAIKPNANVDIVYYFMTTQRCPSCMKIEAYTRDTVQTKYAEALKKGGMMWRMINVDLPENEHYVKDYGLYTKSVVLVKIRNGKQTEWKNLDRVWELLGNEAAFRTYIADEVKKFVEKA